MPGKIWHQAERVQQELAHHMLSGSEQKVWPGYKISRLTPSDSLPLASPEGSLSFPDSAKCSNTGTYERHFSFIPEHSYFQIIILVP